MTPTDPEQAAERVRALDTVKRQANYLAGLGWHARAIRLHEAHETLDTLLAERDRLTEAIAWALGEGDEFPPRGQGEGAYWWRKDLRLLAYGTCGRDCAGCPGCQTGYEVPENVRCHKCGFVTADVFNCVQCRAARAAATPEGET